MALGARASSVEALERAYRSIVQNLNDNDRVLVVAERDGDIVAMAQLARSSADNGRHRAEVQRVAVAAAVRGTGVGRLLMEAVEEQARRCGLTLLWLTTHADTDACAFYEAVGYTQLGVMPNYSTRPDGGLAPAAFYYRELIS